MWVYTSAALEDDRQSILTSSSSLKKQRSVSRTAHRRKIVRGKSSFRKRSATLVLLIFGLLLGAAWAQTESVLYSFCTQTGLTNCDDGEGPSGGVVFDQKGNLYGTTFAGGAYDQCRQYNNDGCGAVFKLSPEGKETVLYSFCAQSNCTDGASPSSGLVFDQKGNLYGTTFAGGAYGYGTVFQLTPKGKETVIYSFCSNPPSCNDGAQPRGGLVFDQEGNLYGSANGGAYAGGVVFKLTAEGKETVLYTFCVQRDCADGEGPNGSLVFDRQGNLYGTTFGGGASMFYGTVFKLTPKGKETVLYSFCVQQYCADGEDPMAGLILDQKGNMYGTTWGGGANVGVIFKLTPKGKERVLYTFCARTGCIDGAYPVAELVFDEKGNLYGTTSAGGAPRFDGVVFRLTPKGEETVLYSFCWHDNCTDGEGPSRALVFDHSGDLYGTTPYGGDFGYGVVFRLTP
jgi:uncharacterized repeat protein (TIGR03803 family)